MREMFALSTSWNASRHSRAKDIIDEIKSLGFGQVELNFNLTSKMVEDMVSLKEEGAIEIVSVHNFCPIPEGASRQNASPDMFSLSALDEAERKKAIDYTKRTIDTAVRAGAKAVVLHGGKVKVQERIKELILFQENRQKYNELRQQMLKERQGKSKDFFNQTLRSLEELCRYAQRQEVKLGIENRYYFSEIPDFKEMEIILATFSGGPLYYWHDVGHAQVYEYLGFIKHKEILDKFADGMVGIHLHDVEGIDDHRAPLKGKFDFSLLKPYLKKETLKVLEPHYPATKKEVLEGKRYLEELFEKVGSEK
ncbi:MAG: sugar phosphate isomerase/epimerase [Candidatus Omnitrophota bacterium]|nr:MAG: sugar phosphate isomerase/epimerase [Candidatus Omnitrophota bacterium]